MMDHPNVAKIFDAGEAEWGAPFSVMEFIEGRPLSDYCDSQRCSPLERIRIFRDICRGIHHAHVKKVAHLDIKPSNIIVIEKDGEPIPKIIDFGIAKAMGRPLTEVIPEMSQGNVAGTPEYMAPEQTRGDCDVDPRADVYSLGVLLYEILTGSPPFFRRTKGREERRRVLEQVRSQDSQLPSVFLISRADKLTNIARNRRIPHRGLAKFAKGDLDWIAAKALQKSKHDRYDTVAALLADVECFLERKPLPSFGGSHVYRGRKFIHRHKTFSWSVVIVLMLVLFGLGLFWANKQQYRREQAQALQRKLFDTPSRNLVAVLEEIEPYHDDLRGRFLYEINHGRSGPIARMRARLALLEDDPSSDGIDFRVVVWGGAGW